MRPDGKVTLQGASPTSPFMVCAHLRAISNGSGASHCRLAALRSGWAPAHHPVPHILDRGRSGSILKQWMALSFQIRTPSFPPSQSSSSEGRGFLQGWSRHYFQSRSKVPFSPCQARDSCFAPDGNLALLWGVLYHPVVLQHSHPSRFLLSAGGDRPTKKNDLWPSQCLTVG